MKMQKNSIKKGMALGLAVGGATAALSTAVMNNSSSMKKVKKNAAKAMKTVGGVLEDVSSIANMKF